MKYRKTILLAVRILTVMVPVGIFSWLAYKDLVVSGAAHMQYDFKNPSPFISVLRPQSRISEIFKGVDGVAYQNIREEPVYFDVRLPRNFLQAKILLRYKNSDEGVMELGAMTDLERWSFDLKPVENKIMNFLIQDKLRWNMIQEGNTLLFQKQKKFLNIGEFLENLPPLDSIASYNYPIEKKYIMPDIKVSEGGADIKKTLRGTHRMFAYVKGEPLEFSFWLQDVNRHTGDDYASIDVYSGKENIYHDFIKLDEDARDKGQMSQVKEVKVFLPELEEGVYKIEVVSPSDDVFIRRIVSSQEHLVFINGVYLGDNSGFSDEFDSERAAETMLVSNIRLLSAKTTHIEGLQNILVRKKPLKIEATHKKYFYEAMFGLNEIVIQKNDVILEGKGLFAFSTDAFFNSEITSLADGSEFDTEKIDYIIADYRPPKDLGEGWRENEVVFDVPSYYTKDHEMHFVLSLPYLEKEKSAVLIAGIEAELKGERLSWRALLNKLKFFFSYGS